MDRLAGQHIWDGGLEILHPIMGIKECSKLVWAANKNYKINIAGKIKFKGKTIPEPGITPREILACKKIKKIVKYTEE